MDTKQDLTEAFIQETIRRLKAEGALVSVKDCKTLSIERTNYGLGGLRVVSATLKDGSVVRL